MSLWSVGSYSFLIHYLFCFFFIANCRDSKVYMYIPNVLSIEIIYIKIMLMYFFLFLKIKNIFVLPFLTNKKK